MRCTLLVGLAAFAAMRLWEAPQPTTGAPRPSSSPLADQQLAAPKTDEPERQATPQPPTVTSAAKELSTLVLLFVAAPDPDQLVDVVEAAAKD